MKYLKSIRIALGAIGTTALLAATANANTITFDTGAGSLNGLPVDAEAVFTTGQDTLSITLRNLINDPKSVIQNLSGIRFTFDGAGTLTPGSLVSSSGRERTINADRTFTDGSAVTTGWEFSSSLLELTMLGASIAPKHTIIGGPVIGGPNAGLYESANSSELGGHNPFLAGDVTFTLAIPGLAADSVVSGAIFMFNTSPGSEKEGHKVPDAASTAGLLGLALVGIGSLRSRFLGK